MTVGSIILLALFLAVLAFAVYLLIRNERVYAFRKRLLNEVSAAAEHDIKNGKPWGWEWRYDRLGDVTYNEMMMSFKPLTIEQWYGDDSFTRP